MLACSITSVVGKLVSEKGLTESFRRVKADIMAFGAELSGIKQSLDYLSKSSGNYADKKEFYNFIRELEQKLKSTFVSRKDVASLRYELRKARQGRNVLSRQLRSLKKPLARISLIERRLAAVSRKVRIK